MKAHRILFGLAAVLLAWHITITELAVAQPIDRVPPPEQIIASPWTVAQRGPHTQRWEATFLVTDEITGQPVADKRSFVQLDVGGFYLDQATGQWEQSQPRFELSPEGGVNASRLYHQVKVVFDPTGIPVLQVELPSGERLTSRILGLGLYEPSTGASVLIGQARAVDG